MRYDIKTPQGTIEFSLTTDPGYGNKAAGEIAFMMIRSGCTSTTCFLTLPQVEALKAIFDKAHSLLNPIPLDLEF